MEGVAGFDELLLPPPLSLLALEPLSDDLPSDDLLSEDLLSDDLLSDDLPSDDLPSLLEPLSFLPDFTLALSALAPLSVLLPLRP